MQRTTSAAANPDPHTYAVANALQDFYQLWIDLKDDVAIAPASKFVE